MKIMPLHKSVKAADSWPDGHIRVPRARGERLIARGLAAPYKPKKKRATKAAK